MKRKYTLKQLNWSIRSPFHVFLICFGLLVTPVQAQQVLDTYITEGLTNNLVLQDKKASLEQSLLALKDAKSFFLPSMDEY